MVTQVPSRGLTSVEQSLVEHVRCGEWLDLAADDETVDEAAMRSWGESRTCRASVIRDILRGRLAANPDPHGLRLRGARITGRIDLEKLTTNVSLELRDCLLEQGVLAQDARLGSVVLAGCQFEHPADPPLDAQRLTCSVLLLLGARAIGHVSTGAVNLGGAHIGGQFACLGADLRNDSGPALYADSLQVDHGMYITGSFTGSGLLSAVNLIGARISGNLECNGTHLRNDSGPALNADGLQVGRSVYLTGGFTATGSGGAGAVRLQGAHIGGTLDCPWADLRNESGPALHADGVQVEGGMYLTGRFTATGSGGLGAVRLPGAHIGSQFACTGAHLRNASGPALNAAGMQVSLDMYLIGGFTATGGSEDAAVDLGGAHVGGQFDCTGAVLRNDSGLALYADSLQVGQSVFMRDGFTATGSGGLGAVNLRVARIGGNLECNGAKLRNDSGPALHADGLQVDQGMSLSGGFTATGSGDDGAVRLLGAHIGGDLYCAGAHFGNESGPALQADRLQVGRSMSLRGEFTATGSGGLGTVRLGGAHIEGRLDCRGAQLRNDSGSALYADGLQVDRSMLLTDGFTATGGGEGATLDLTIARLGGKLQFAPKRLKHKADSHRRLAVDGLTYSGVPEPISAEGWRELLRDGTPRYAAQPYQQLAAGYRELGDDRQTRETLMRQRDDQLARADTRWPERLWGRITMVTLGYGYQPWRALVFLAGVMIVSCVLAWLLGAHGALAQTSKTTTPGRSCTVVQQVSVGLDLNLPVGTSVARADCDLTSDAASATAAWLSVVGWILRVLAWAFAALFFAGFTSAVRKT